MKKCVLSAWLCVFIFNAFGHEYVLLAAHFRVKKGDNLEMHLFVADGFNIELERNLQKDMIDRFELLTRDSIIDLTTQPDGILPIANPNVSFEGGGLFHLERKYGRISLPSPKFIAYLKEDHMEEIIPMVDKTKLEQKERYTRYIKSLVQSEDSYADTMFKTIVGQKFEIILLQNPYTLKPGAILKARILFEGRPLVGKAITARNRTGNSPEISAVSKTDKNGICAFKLKRKGDWFLHATHMVQCPDKSDSDWESFWASYSFGLD
ncbi:MAG: DUF4198 domain-containing protein [Saprospiraceae bacterium]